MINFKNDFFKKEISNKMSTKTGLKYKTEDHDVREYLLAKSTNEAGEYEDEENSGGEEVSSKAGAFAAKLMLYAANSTNYKFLLQQAPEGETETDKLKRQSVLENQGILPLKTFGMSGRVKHTLSNLLSRLEAANLLKNTVALVKATQRDHVLSFNSENITLTHANSLIGDIEREIMSIATIIDKTYSIIHKRSSSATYAIAQIALFEADPAYVKAACKMMTEAFEGHYFKDIDFSELNEKIVKESTMISDKSKKNGLGKVVVPYPKYYVKVSKLIVGLYKKWTSTSKAQSTSVVSIREKQDREERVRGNDKDEKVKNVLRYLVAALVPNESDRQTVRDSLNAEVLFNLLMPETRGKLTYESLHELYKKIGGDPQLLPVFKKDLTTKNILSALKTISKGSGEHNYVNESFNFIFFRFFGLLSSLEEKSFDIWKVVSKDVAAALAGLSKDGVKLVEKLESKSSLKHANGKTFLVQRSSMTISSFIKTEDVKTYHDHTNIVEAINLLNYAITCVEEYFARSIVDFKKTRESAKKALLPKKVRKSKKAPVKEASESESESESESSASETASEKRKKARKAEKAEKAAPAQQPTSGSNNSAKSTKAGGGMASAGKEDSSSASASSKSSDSEDNEAPVTKGNASATTSANKNANSSASPGKASTTKKGNASGNKKDEDKSSSSSSTSKS